MNPCNISKFSLLLLLSTWVEEKKKEGRRREDVVVCCCFCFFFSHCCCCFRFFSTGSKVEKTIITIKRLRNRKPIDRNNTLSTVGKNDEICLHYLHRIVVTSDIHTIIYPILCAGSTDNKHRCKEH